MLLIWQPIIIYAYFMKYFHPIYNNPDILFFYLIWITTTLTIIARHWRAKFVISDKSPLNNLHLQKITTNITLICWKVSLNQIILPISLVCSVSWALLLNLCWPYPVALHLYDPTSWGKTSVISKAPIKITNI